MENQPFQPENPLIAQVHTNVTFDMYKQSHLIQNKQGNIGLAIFVILFLFFAINDSVINSNLTVLSIFLFLIALAFFLLFLSGVRAIGVQSYYRSSIHQFLDKGYDHYFYHSYFLVLCNSTSSSSKMTISYQYIKKIIETNDYFLIFLANNNYIFVQKSQFNYGNPTEFPLFLANAAPQAQYIKKIKPL